MALFSKQFGVSTLFQGNNQFLRYKLPMFCTKASPKSIWLENIKKPTPIHVNNKSISKISITSKKELVNF